MVDTTDLKSVDLTVVPVRVRPAAPYSNWSLDLQILIAPEGLSFLSL